MNADIKEHAPAVEIAFKVKRLFLVMCLKGRSLSASICVHLRL
jgi:hypothetical protein